MAESSPTEIPNMTETTCKNCRFWCDHDAGWDNGECRRHAPTAVHFAQTMDEDEKRGERDTVWPATCADEWCGEWEAAATHKATAAYDPDIGK